MVLPDKEAAMPTHEATGLIKVISIPEGEAPEEIRAAWVGLVLPCYPIEGYLEGEEFEILSRKPAAKRRRCVVIPQTEALEILEKEHPEAAKWWEDHGFPLQDRPNFSFPSTTLLFVSGVTQQRMIEITDEMTGDPYR